MRQGRVHLTIMSRFRYMEWGCKGGSCGNRVNVEAKSTFTLLLLRPSVSTYHQPFFLMLRADCQPAHLNLKQNTADNPLAPHRMLRKVVDSTKKEKEMETAAVKSDERSIV